MRLNLIINFTKYMHSSLILTPAQDTQYSFDPCPPNEFDPTVIADSITQSHASNAPTKSK